MLMIGKQKSKKPKRAAFKGKYIIGLFILVVISVWYIYKPISKSVDTPLHNSNPAATALQCAEELPVSELAGQVLMVGLPASEINTEESLFRQYHIGGAIIMSSPENPRDGSIKRFKLKAGTGGIPLLISTDEEGGLVQRFSSLGYLPAPAEVAKSLSPDAARLLVAQHGKKLKFIGVDMVLGPLADVAPETSAGILGNRVFSSDPNIVSQYDTAFVTGWQSAGIIPTLKHFPGLGSATGNTDFEISNTPPLSSLLRRDFIPYRSLSIMGAAVMVGNQNTPGWFDGPASLSPVVNQYLRQTLGYKNDLIITDSLDAAAITKSMPVSEAAVASIKAGNDIVLIVNPDPTKINRSQNQKLIASTIRSIEEAVKNRMLPKQQLALAASHKLHAQGLSACQVSG